MSPENYIISDIEAFENLLRILNEKDSRHLCLDLETDDAREKLAKIHGIGLCLDDSEAFYIPIRDNKKDVLWKQEELEYIYSSIKDICCARGLVGWNLVYDVLVFEYNSGLNISDAISIDGILLKHTINEERPHGLKETAVKYLGAWADKAQEKLYENIKANGGSTKKDNVEMWKADENVLAEYCCWDVILTIKLINLFLPQLKEQGLEKFFFEEEVMPLNAVTIDMKRSGFPVNVEYFKELHKKIVKDIDFLQRQILGELKDHINSYEEELLNEEFPCKRTGNFPKMLAKVFNYKLPEKEGKISLAKKEVEQYKDKGNFYKWLLGDDTQIPASDTIRSTQRALFFEKYPEQTSVFNLGSNNDLKWLFFEKLNLKPLSKTEGGEPQVDEDFLGSIKSKYPFVNKLLDYKKLQKLDGTYILGILERQIDGVLYSSFLQFGTTSGRYSSTNPNLQNLPRIKDEEAELSPLVLGYVNSIKRGFVAPSGCVILNSDYSQLEPCCFAHASGDETLREVFRKGYDLYSQIAIDVFGLKDCSADKKAKNYLKKLHPEKRQLVKVFCLAVVYGAQAGRISEVMGVPYKEAEQVIMAYLEAYPELKSYMDRCDWVAKKNGYIKNEFGRVRHLPQAKALYSRWGNQLLDPGYSKRNGLGDLRYTFKNSLNNAKNFPIQSTAASVVNRAMIAFHKKTKEKGFYSPLVAQVHDELTALVKEEDAEAVKQIMKECMENTTKISVPLQTEPLIAKTWAEAK